MSRKAGLAPIHLVQDEAMRVVVATQHVETHVVRLASGAEVIVSRRRNECIDRLGFTLTFTTTTYMPRG